jgi:hypothetical protein
MHGKAEAMSQTTKRKRDVAALVCGIVGLALLLIPALPLPFGQRLSALDLLTGALSKGGFNLWRLGLLVLFLGFIGLTILGASSILRSRQSASRN